MLKTKNLKNTKNLKKLKKLNKLVEENTKSNSKINSYNRLLNLSLNRKIIKKALMVKPYNASLVSMAEYIIEQMLPMEVSINKKGEYRWNRELL